MSLSMESRTIEELVGNATKSWEKEFQDNGWTSTTMDESGFTSAIRHATQMVWAETGLIGCGVGRCGTDYYMKEHLATVVCRYGEPGNYIGSDIYVKGDGCSSCAAGLQCETDSGLFIFANVSYILEILYTANTSSHFIVCLLMSSQYRRTVRNVLPCGRNLPADGRSRGNEGKRRNIIFCDPCQLEQVFLVYENRMEFCIRDDFIGFSNSTIFKLCEFKWNLICFYTTIKPFKYYMSIPCTLINLFHFFILTRKSMSTSSVYLIMSAVAVSDVVFMIENFYHLFIQIAIAYSGCIEERTYGMVLTNLIFLNLPDFAKRCSIWFCFLIALIRTLVIRNPMSSFYENLSNSVASYVTIPAVTLISLSLSAFKASFFKIVVFESVFSCKFNNTIQGYSYIVFDSHVLKYFNAVDSIISSIIPCMFLPFLTLLHFNFDIKNLLEFANHHLVRFSIGLVRLLVVRNPMYPFYDNLSKPFTAYVTISGVTLASLSFSAFKALFIVIFEMGSISICNSETKSPSIPCVLFTFLTGMLVLEVKKANKNRSKLFSSSKDKESRNNTQLVLYFTLTFFVALFPLGVTSAIVDHIVEKVGFTVIGANFGSLLGVLYTANTSTHFVVCILISSLHQKTVKDAMLCGRNVVHTSTSMS
ncbi:Protein CBG01226 [Caenorhabditis briggsae]|uniref:Protein CBG01226 n=1 Tax=Caenorhabditis briggsae TaxID=6238 RepID=A8WPW2_CAEBR|nr:Protein CBG01226 [Caenorhabditis briggsae]CAP22520.2 Protein CBG01226 [Caenorhabditis briggsae]